MKGVFINFAILQVLFLALFAYIFGSLYQQTSHVHNVKILFIDYDQGLIGSSIRAAYQTMQANSFPTLVERSPDGIAAPGDIRTEVCKAHYWAALWVAPRATENLESAFSGGNAAASYNRSDVVTYIWNEARYSTSADSIVQANLQALSTAARVAYSARNGTGALQSLDRTDQAAVEAFSNPWILSQMNIQPTSQGSRAIYNTLGKSLQLS